jgi:hypothetical protein
MPLLLGMVYRGESAGKGRKSEEAWEVGVVVGNLATFRCVCVS